MLYSYYKEGIDMKKILKVSLIMCFVVLLCCACDGDVTRDIRHDGFAVGGDFNCPLFFPKDKEDTSYQKIKYLTGTHIITSEGNIYEYNLQQKYANKMNCKQADTQLVVKAIFDNKIIKATDNKYYYLVGENSVSPYTAVTLGDNNYVIYDLLLNGEDVIKVSTANSSTGTYYVLKTDGNVYSYTIQKADRKTAVEVFTTNYDYLFEVAFEHKALPYYDGFTGAYEPFFDGRSVDDMSFLPKQTKLWKIHGSLGWHYDKERGRVLRRDPDNNDILIYPSTLKYDQSRKQPYTALGDRLSNFIKQDDTILIVCGYSFGDEHINERINTALSMNPLGQVYVLFYDTILEKQEDDTYKKIGNSFNEDCALAKMAISNSKLSVLSGRSAVIGGVYGKWKLKREPDKEDTINVNFYYDEDAYSNNEDAISSDSERKEILQGWSGEGELIITDFSRFVAFLKNMIITNGRPQS